MLCTRGGKDESNKGQSNHFDSFFLKKWAIPGLCFINFRLFNTVGCKYMFYIKIRQWLDSNHGPLVLEATALPNESQPLPTPFDLQLSWQKFFWGSKIWYIKVSREVMLIFKNLCKKTLRWCFDPAGNSVCVIIFDKTLSYNVYWKQDESS